MKRPNAATQVFAFVGQTLASSSNVAAGFTSHLQAPTTLITNKEFDADHFTQVHSDMLALGGSCRNVSRSLELKEINSKDNCCNHEV